ncbi:MAG TPA: hypothetical protein VEI03_21055 [Stellaceae bacterium]|nr:hypothetical protein [Stellaceae bacterium]
MARTSSPEPTLYAISPSDKHDVLTVKSVWSGDEPLASGLAHLVPFTNQGTSYLLGVNAKGAASAYRLRNKAPWIEPVKSAIDLGGPCDIVQPFAIGGRLHFIAYTAKAGLLKFFAIGDGLASSKKPFEYFRHRQPGVTTGWTVLQPVTHLNKNYYMTYGFHTGAVELFSISVAATVAGDVPPLDTENVWSWVWAKGWTRFAFFQLGGENFFLKTNTLKPNVNIDHLDSDPNIRSNEVGTEMDLEDAQQLDICSSFYQNGNTPYFITYMKNGKTTVNRVHGDCLGWTTEARLTAVKGASQIVTYGIDGQTFALFY